MIPNMKKRSSGTLELYCNSLFWNYDEVQEGKTYTYDELRQAVKKEDGTILPKRHGGKDGRRDIQFDAWRITLDIEVKESENAYPLYLVTKKHNYSREEKIDIIEDMTQEYLLSRNNTSGLVYNIVLLLLTLRGKDLYENRIPYKEMEFSKNKWEVEVGIVSRVFQKLLFNGNNIMTDSVLGNILKNAVDKVKKNIFIRALEFMGKDPDIEYKSKFKVLYIDIFNDEGMVLTEKEAAVTRKIKYGGKYYDYHTAYANNVFIETLSIIEEEVLEELGLNSKREAVATGKYAKFKARVAARISKLDGSWLIEGASRQKKSAAQEQQSHSIELHEYKILSFWKVYDIKANTEKLLARIKNLLAAGNFENEEITSLLESYTDAFGNISVQADLLKGCLTVFKKELNEYVKMRVASKVDLDNYNLDDKEVKTIAEELAWISCFAKYARYRVYSPKEWENFLLGMNRQNIIEKDGIKFIYDDKGAILGMIDDNYDKINFETGEIIIDKDEDENSTIDAIVELEPIVSEIIKDNKSLIEVRDNYNRKMEELIQSMLLAQRGEISERGFDLEAMNNKIREVMLMEFKPRKDALKIARRLMNNNVED